jgi:hypothetical protein
MFMFDVETLGKRSNSVILSMACTWFDPESKPKPETLRGNTFFAKFSVSDQIQRLKRESDKSTIEWWAKQCENVRIKSFKPSAIDVPFEQGYERMCKWARSYNEPDSWVWARGNLDQLVLDDIVEQCELEHVFPHYRWRDVRTAVDFLYGTKNGYVKVDYPKWDSFLEITKHNPVDDCILDVMQILYGVTGEEDDRRQE